MARIPDEYAVFVAPGKGTLKTLDEATGVRQVRPQAAGPPATFCDAVVVGSIERATRGRRASPSQPVPDRHAGRNPTLPKKVAAAERPKADDVPDEPELPGKSYSLIHKTKKPIHAGGADLRSEVRLGQLVKPGEVVPAAGQSDGEMLERAAQQANSLVEVLAQA